MSLLVLDCVTKRSGGRRSSVTVLDEISLTVEPGEIVAVCGSRGSGRATLLAVAAGAERPDSGVVLFDGRDVTRHKELGNGISLVVPDFPADIDATMAERVGMPLLFKGATMHQGRRQGATALGAVGIEDVATFSPAQCRDDELELAAFARAAITKPRLLICDVPIIDRAASMTDRVIDLLRAFALLDGMAVLVATDGTFKGADRTLTLQNGQLHAGDGVWPAGSAAPRWEDDH